MEWLEDLLKTQNNITIFFSIILVLFILSSIIKNITIIIEGVEKGYLNIIKFLKWVFRIFLFPFKLISKFFKWIFTIKERYLHKKEVLNSKYNVFPEKFKIPLWRRFISYKIRREKKSRFRCIEKAIETQKFLNQNLRFINMIETSVGGGKSSLMAGLTHFEVIHFQEMIKNKLENTRKILYRIDWKKIDDIIEKTYEMDSYIPNIMKEILNQGEIANLFHGYYNSFIQETPKMTLLKDYVTAYCASIRNNYVMSNYKLYNRLTKTFNIAFPPNLLNIKDPVTQSNYYIPAYCCFVEDELSIGDSKNTTVFTAASDKGKDLTLRLFRQLKNETTCYIGASQKVSRVVKIERELANSYFEITDLSIVGAQKTYSRIFQKKEEKLIKKMSKKKYQDNIPEFKKKIFDAYQEQNKILAAGFLKYTVRIARNIRDLDKFDKSSLAVQELYIPMTWAFGTYLKCQFMELDEFLNNESKKSDKDLKFVDDFFSKSDPKTFEEILKNREQKLKEKEERKEKEKEEKKKKKEKESKKKKE